MRETTHKLALVDHGCHNILWATQYMSVKVVAFEFSGGKARCHSPREELKLCKNV